MKVLVVDDDPSIRQLLQITLQVEGYEVMLAEDGQKALEIAENQALDLVILDLMLPVIDGWQVCRRLREDRDWPIIMLTAKDEEVDTVTGLKIGADDYVTKPFSPRELVARIEAVLRRTNRLSGGPKNCITYPGITIDLMKREVSVNGVNIEMSPKEFEIIWEMAQRPGQVYSRETLLDKIWGYDYFGTSRTVDVHIKRLRAKLEQVQGHYSYIQTVWGVGYKFEVISIE